MWNIAREGAWERYKLESNKQSEKIMEVIENKELSIEEAAQRFEKIHEKIKFKSFGKVTIGSKKSHIKEASDDISNEDDAAEVDGQVLALFACAKF